MLISGTVGQGFQICAVKSNFWIPRSCHTLSKQSNIVILLSSCTSQISRTSQEAIIGNFFPREGFPVGVMWALLGCGPCRGVFEYGKHSLSGHIWSGDYAHKWNELLSLKDPMEGALANQFLLTLAQN